MGDQRSQILVQTSTWSADRFDRVEWQGKMSGRDTGSFKTSVVIATYNGAARLKSCLQALAAQEQSAADFEVIAVVDGSTDGSREMLAQSRLPYSLRVLWQENRGQAAALNLGAQEALGHYLLFLDDDIVAQPGLIAEHQRMQEKRQGAVVVGSIGLKLSEGSDWFARCFATGWHRHYQRLNQQTDPLSWADCYGGNLSMPREVFQK